MVRPIGEQALAAGEGGLKNLKTAITTLLQVGKEKKVWLRMANGCILVCNQ
jgi:hypothetical protein